MTKLRQWLIITVMLSLTFMAGCGLEQGGTASAPGPELAALNLGKDIPMPDAGNTYEVTVNRTGTGALMYGWNSFVFPLAQAKRFSLLMLSYNAGLKFLNDAAQAQWIADYFLVYSQRKWQQPATSEGGNTLMPGQRYWLWCYKKGTVLYFDYPFIASISPDKAAVDTPVTLTGGNFTAGSTVAFNASAAAVLSWNETAIVCNVPSNLVPGNVTVRVTNGSLTSQPYAYSVIIAPGTLKWSGNFYWMGYEMRGGPAIGSDGAIYCASTGNSGEVCAFNPDGSKKWDNTTASGVGVQKELVIGAEPQGMIFGATLSDGMRAWLPANGVTNWTTALGSCYGGSALAQDGTLYAIARRTGASDLKAYNSNGSLKWIKTLPQTLNSTPSLAPDGTIYVGGNRILWAIRDDGASAQDLWSITINDFDGGDCSPAMGADGTIYATSRQYANKLHAINPVTHAEKWSASLGTTVTNYVSSPVVGSDGTIYAGSYDNRVVALNPNGTQKWVFNTAGAVYSTPCLTTDGTIYFSGMDAKLYAIKENGTQADLLWTYPLRSGTFSSPTVDADGIVYVGATGTVYAIYGTAPLDTAAPWPKERHDLKRTGRYGGF